MQDTARAPSQFKGQKTKVVLSDIFNRTKHEQKQNHIYCSRIEPFNDLASEHYITVFFSIWKMPANKSYLFHGINEKIGYVINILRKL